VTPIKPLYRLIYDVFKNFVTGCHTKNPVIFVRKIYSGKRGKLPVTTCDKKKTKCFRAACGAGLWHKKICHRIDNNPVTDYVSSFI